DQPHVAETVAELPLSLGAIVGDDVEPPDSRPLAELTEVGDDRRRVGDHRLPEAKLGARTDEEGWTLEIEGGARQVFPPERVAVARAQLQPDRGDERTRCERSRKRWRGAGDPEIESASAEDERGERLPVSALPPEDRRHGARQHGRCEESNPDGAETGGDDRRPDDRPRAADEQNETRRDEGKL